MAADKKISQLDAASALVGDELLEVVQGGANKRTTPAAIETYLGLGTAATTDADAYATAAQGALADSALQPGDIDTVPADDNAAPIASSWAYNKALVSDPAGVTGADRVTNVISLTQSEYDAITPDASTLYVITD